MNISAGLTFENYKSFGPGLVGLERIAPINLIIGRNNSGKSALLDIVAFACHRSAIVAGLYHKEKKTRVLLTDTITDQQVRAVFPTNANGGPLNGNHYQIGVTLIGSRLTAELQPDSTPVFQSIVPPIDPKHLRPAQEISGYYNGLANRMSNPFKEKLFHRLLADRDIVAEQMQPDLHINANGAGLTSTIAQILNRSQLPTELVADRLLFAVNEIFSPDLSFSEIDVQQHGDGGPWEVYLNEKGKGRIALTHSGSGIKTVLLAASYFALLPFIKKKPLSEFVFAFEELENNLHPALQRRLIRYITDEAKKAGSVLFITSHSNVLIDQLSRNPDAQIIHVTQSNGVSQIRQIQTYVDNRGVLDDLDVRASDLLQANGIVWVEGPSDRLYFNRWISLYSDGQLTEGIHYQCVFYGGRLLAHLSADVDGIDTDDAVRILRVNKNAFVLIDSDKSNTDDEINDTKRRIVREIEAIGGMAWVTDGREVENYLPLSAIQTKFGTAQVAPDKFDDIGDYLEGLQRGARQKFNRNKVLFAETMVPAITKDDLNDRFDLSERISQAVQVIRKWNALS